LPSICANHCSLLDAAFAALPENAEERHATPAGSPLI
jgi:hypothetical protein